MPLFIPFATIGAHVAGRMAAPNSLQLTAVPLRSTAAKKKANHNFGYVLRKEVNMLALTTHKKHFNTVDCSSTETNPCTGKKAENETPSDHKKCMGYGACYVSGCPCNLFLICLFRVHPRPKFFVYLRALCG